MIKFNENILNRFGQPTGAWAKLNKSTTQFKMDSADDFNKYFYQKLMLAQKLEKTPSTDTLVKSSNKFTTIPSIFDNFLK